MKIFKFTKSNFDLNVTELRPDDLSVISYFQNNKPTNEKYKFHEVSYSKLLKACPACYDLEHLYLVLSKLQKLKIVYDLTKKINSYRKKSRKISKSIDKKKFKYASKGNSKASCYVAVVDRPFVPKTILIKK